jgi:cation diffusion facilitator CzcD-associated flavoprotein CzcO
MSSQNLNNSEAEINADAIIVGAGFSGCYALYRLRSMGYTVKILEAATGFGGVWHLNRYPGARVDSECPVYQLNVKQVWKDFNFSETYPDHRELRKYFDHMDRTLDLRKDTIFEARVDDVKYSVEQKLWSFRTRSGLKATSKYAIFAVGASTKQYIPDWPRLRDFKGEIIHPANWPEDFDPKSKKIGLIGQGASGLQIVQELAKEECELTILLRTPVTALPMRQKVIAPDSSEWIKGFYNAIFNTAKYSTYGAFPYNASTHSWHDLSADERHQHYEQLWSSGGFGILVSNFPEIMTDKTANAEFYQFWAKKVRERITDPRKRDLLAPLEQPYWIGTKRPSLEQDYYDCIDRSNVKVVNLKEAPIKKFVPQGITVGNETTDETLQFDAVVVATGYDNLTGSLFDMNIHDRNGIKLQKRWEQGVSTHLGIAVPGLPNAFFLYAPQAPSSLANGPPFIEMQVDWLVKLLEKAKADNITTLEASAQAAETWRAMNKAAFDQSLLQESTAWVVGANIPGKIREPLCWLEGMTSWWKHCEDALHSWEQSGFITT